MTDHGWPEQHDDIGDDDLAGLPDGEPVGDLPGFGPDLPGDDVWDVPDPAEPPAGLPDLPVAPEPDLELPGVHEDPAGPPAGYGPPVGADLDAVAEPDQPVPVFPPVLDVGPLPEPVDGFPWIDTGSLGVADLAAAAGGAPTAPELAGHAAVDLPPGVDPWAVLEDSDDPATAALARFYRPGDTSPDS